MKVSNVFSVLISSILLSLSLALAGDEAVSKISALTFMTEFSEALKEPQTNYQELEAKLVSIFSQLENIDPLSLDLDEIRKNTNLIIRATDSFNREIVQRIPEWKEQGVWTDKSETVVRNILRGLRAFGDSVGEYSLSLGHSKAERFNLKTFTGGAPFVVTHDGSHFDPYTHFKPGDVIMMRGSSEISAAIARVADVNTQFSHAAIVTQDPKTGELYLQEALIEKGLTLSPIKDFIDHAIGRAVVFRHEDAQKAQKASAAAWELSQGGQKYIYDFSMKYDISPEELRANPRLFCTIVLRNAFYGDEKNPYILPKNPSKLNPKNREFLRLIGIEDGTTSIFAPSDMELDPDFTKVAEFRDFSKTSTQRVYDAIFDKVFEWMDEGGHFKEYKIVNILTKFGYNLSKIEFVKKALWKMGIPVAPHVKPSVLRAVLSISAIRMTLQKELQPKIDAYVKKHGIVPTPKMLAEWLDDIRAKGKNLAFKVLELGPKSTRGMCVKFYKN